ncbi:MAG: putative phosphodiesterase [Desulforhopalus sp.]|jgi:predicted phosphodiesterase
MAKRILLISDIHGNAPALQAIQTHFKGLKFDAIINCGDTLVYAPFPNETLDLLRQLNAISILGNTDKKVIKLLQEKSFTKPGKPEKRIMYESTAEALTQQNSNFLQGFKKKTSYTVYKKAEINGDHDLTIGIFHGSPAAHHEFLFDTTDDSRFKELAASCKHNIVVTGHSHTPYYKHNGGVHFINPGSVGRMFDGDAASSCAVLTISADTISVIHHRVSYDVEVVIRAIIEQNLPEIYSQMFRLGKKLN